MSIKRLLTWTATTAAATLIATSCTSDGDVDKTLPDPTQPGSVAQEAANFEEIDCPTEVSITVVIPATCGLLSVPERRPGTGTSIKVFVTRIASPPDATGAEPVLVIGGDTAHIPNYGGIAPLAERVGREVIVVDSRGTGHSEPALECPKMDRLARPALGAPSDDAAMRKHFLDMASDCFNQLTAEGVDVGAYNVTEMAADAEDLRIALGIDQWDVISYGTAARVASELVRQSPEHVRALILDSPELPGMDPRSVAQQHTSDLMTAILDACSADHRCDDRFPTARGSLEVALNQLVRRPMTLRVTEGDGTSVRILLDAGMLLRVLRQMVSDGGSTSPTMTIGAVPAVVEAVTEQRADRLTTELGTSLLLATQSYCIGYEPHCLWLHRVSIGVAYTVLCHDIAPFTHAEVLEPGAPPGVREAFSHSPYLDVCSSWPVGRASPKSALPMESDIPTLVTIGGFAPYTPEPEVMAAIAGLTDVSVVVDPAGGHNVIARTECMLALRNLWVDTPDQVSAPPCLSGAKVDWELR